MGSNGPLMVISGVTEGLGLTVGFLELTYLGHERGSLYWVKGVWKENTLATEALGCNSLRGRTSGRRNATWFSL